MALSEPPAVPVDSERPWHAAFPAPTAAASIITRETILSWMQAGRLPGNDFVLVDLRRMDYEVSPGSDILMLCACLCRAFSKRKFALGSVF
jgi:hypothetical protein